MALDKCRECGGSASTSAQSCPHCGAPNEVAVGERGRPEPSPSTASPRGEVLPSGRSGSSSRRISRKLEKLGYGALAVLATAFGVDRLVRVVFTSSILSECWPECPSGVSAIWGRSVAGAVIWLGGAWWAGRMALGGGPSYASKREIEGIIKRL